MASNQGAVGVRYSYIICSAAENEFRHVETIPFLQWSLHRYGRSYGDRRDTYRRPDEGEGYNVQRAEKDMVQLGSLEVNQQVKVQQAKKRYLYNKLLHSAS